MDPKSYNLYNILKVRTNADFLPEFFQENIDEPDLEILKKDFRFDKKGLKPQYFGFSLRFFSGNEKIFAELNPGKQLYKLLLSDLKDKTKFYYDTSGLYDSCKGIAEFFEEKLNFKSLNAPFRLFDLKDIFKLLLQIKLLQKDYTLIHSAFLEKDGEGVLLPAWQATGKSTTSYHLRKHGFKVLDDEVSIVSPDSKIYKVFKIGSRTDSKGNRTPFELSKSPKTMNLNKIFFLSRGQRKIEEIDSKRTINMIISSTNYEFQGFLPRSIFLSYCFSSLFPPDLIESRTREILKEAFKNKKCFLVYGDRNNFHKTIKENF